jgi:hypothetical protein
MLQPVMKTNATSFPDAAFAAALRSVSLREDDMVVPDPALAVIATRGLERNT